jgi:benzoate/toluate 1,2-dioxygenase beta subunit
MTAETMPPARSYVDAAFYDRAHAITSRGRGPADAQAHADAVADFLLHEARLLEEERFDEWLGLFTERCVYWVAASDPPAHPARSVAITFDDRRRLEDRIIRLQSGYAYSQIPASRVSRTLGRPECWKMEHGLLVRIAFHLSEYREGELNFYAGRYEYSLNFYQKSFRIDQKSIILVNCNRPLKNISFIM